MACYIWCDVAVARNAVTLALHTLTSASRTTSSDSENTCSAPELQENLKWLQVAQTETLDQQEEHTAIACQRAVQLDTNTTSRHARQTLERS